MDPLVVEWLQRDENHKLLNYLNCCITVIRTESQEDREEMRQQVKEVLESFQEKFKAMAEMIQLQF